MGYATANFSMGPPELQTTAAEAPQALANATTEGRTAVANLSHTNGILNNQVVNLTQTLLAKESNIKEFHKIISKLSCTIHMLAPSQSNCSGRGGQGR
eukprot:2978425-Ditylum_brightwellii.AAC.1